MRKEKNLSLILIGLISLSQIGLLIGLSRKAYASIDKNKKDGSKDLKLRILLGFRPVFLF